MKVGEMDTFKRIVLLMCVGEPVVAGQMAGYTQRKQASCDGGGDTG